MLIIVFLLFGIESLFALQFDSPLIGLIGTNHSAGV